MKKCRILLFSVLLMSFFLLTGMDAAAAEAKVFDYAGLFSESETMNLQKQAESIAGDHDLNMIILTIDDAEGKDSRDYADDFYENNGFYGNGAKGGTLFLIDMDNREVYMSNSGDMSYYITDKRRESVLDAAGYDRLKNQEYASCMEDMMDETLRWVEKGIPADQYTYDEATGKIVRYRSIRPFEWVIAAVIALVSAAAACGGVIGKYRLKWGGYKYPYRDKSKVTLKRKEDRFMNQVVTTRRIPRNPPPSSGGGGGGGRTTIHTSSGGGSFSGGGRKF